MNKYLLMAVCVLLAIIYPFMALANEDSPVCTDIGGVMYGAQTECKKGDIIVVNPMMAAFLCDLTLSSISGEKSVVCHYLGKKRPERKRKSKK